MKLRKQRGMSLLELMIALTVLVIGLLSALLLIMTAVATNSRNRMDTSGTFVSQVILESILTQPGSGAITITDCGGNNITIQTAGPSTAGSSLGANLLTDGTGRIDFSQATSGITAGYSASYVGCGSGGRQLVYDVRWNVQKMSQYSRQVTVAARQSRVIGNGTKTAGLYLAIPANLRSVLTSY